MHARIVQRLLLGAVILGGIASGAASATAAPSALAQQATAATPRAAVLQIIRPFYNRSTEPTGCNAATDTLAACPITARLRAAVARERQWERAHTRGGNGNEFCRCQAAPRRIVLTGVKTPYITASGQFAEVETVWFWGSRPVNITWLTRHVQGGWQLDNSFCTGYGQKTNLYHIPVGPCPAT